MKRITDQFKTVKMDASLLILFLPSGRKSINKDAAILTSVCVYGLEVYKLTVK